MSDAERRALEKASLDGITWKTPEARALIGRGYLAWNEELKAYTPSPKGWRLLGVRYVQNEPVTGGHSERS